MTEIWQEPVRGAAADPAILALPGLEQLRPFLDGRAPAPPVARLTGRALAEAEEGRVVYSMPVTGWVVGPKGTLHPGVLAFLADAPLLAAVVSTLPPATPTTTAEVSITFLGTASLGDELRAEGRVIHVDATTGLAEVFVRAATARLLAHGTIARLHPPGARPRRRRPADRAAVDPRRSTRRQTRTCARCDGGTLDG